MKGLRLSDGVDVFVCKATFADCAKKAEKMRQFFQEQERKKIQEMQDIIDKHKKDAEELQRLDSERDFKANAQREWFRKRDELHRIGFPAEQIKAIIGEMPTIE
jgi:hypothetical protein